MPTLTVPRVFGGTLIITYTPGAPPTPKQLKVAFSSHTIDKVAFASRDMYKVAFASAGKYTARFTEAIP